MEDRILPRAAPCREERVAIIEAGRRELWRIYYPNKEKLEVRHIDEEAEKNDKDSIDI